MEKRKEKRIGCEAVVYLTASSGATATMGTTSDLSPHGMRVLAERVFPIHIELEISMKGGRGFIPLRGTVCWNCEITGGGAEEHSKMGIFIADPPPEFSRFFELLNSE